MVTFSPAITPTRYERATSDKVGGIQIVEYDDWQLDIDCAAQRDKILKLGDEMCYTITEMGEAYFSQDSALVDRTMYDTVRMLVIREMLYRELLEMDIEGCVDGFEPTDKRTVTGVRGMDTDESE